MKAKQQQVKALLVGIQNDYKNYTALVDMLTFQRDAIIARQSEQLARINMDITELYQTIAKNTQERLTILNDLHIPLHAEGMESLFSRLPENLRQPALTLWKKLEVQVKTCQKLNERNAHLLRMQHEIVTSLLEEPTSDIYKR